MNMSRMLWATTVLFRSFPSTRAFFISKPSLVPTFPTASLLLVNRRSSSTRASRFRSTAGKNQEKRAPKINKKRNRQLLRADRVLANRGWGSRSECTELLRRRRVSILNDNGERTIIKGPSEKITMDTTLFVDNTPVPTIPLLMVYHKPKWVLSVLNDPQDRPNLGTLLTEVQKRQKLHPVGRLDYDTSGLLLFSTNGSLTQRLLHPTHAVEKEYVALVDGTVDREELQSQLKRGVETAEGVHTAQLLEVTHVESSQVPQLLERMQSNLPGEYNVTDLEERGYLFSDCTALSEVRLSVSEGKHRMVRRMLANCGHGVVELRRERHGDVVLGELAEGEFRELTQDEQEWAESLLSKQTSKGSKQ